MPNITILVQEVLKIFCSHLDPLWLQWVSMERGIIQSNIHRWKVNQVIYIMYPNCMPDILILAQAVFQVFCSHLRWLCYTICQSRKIEIIQLNIYRNLPKVNHVIYTFDTVCMPNIMILAQVVLQIFCSQWSLWVKWMSKKGNNSVKYSQNFMKIRFSTLCTQIVCLIWWY